MAQGLAGEGVVTGQIDTCITILSANSKLVENFEPSSEYTRCSGDSKEKLSTNIRSDYATDFCHDRKFAFNAPKFCGKRRRTSKSKTKKTDRKKRKVKGEFVLKSEC